MEEGKYKKIYVEWWRIRRSTVTGLILLFSVTLAISLGVWWAVHNNWFVAQDMSDVPRNAARIISFEGDVRITRAATRETVLVTKEIYVMAGDTIQTQADGRAKVQMIDQSVYSLRPNSTLVIRDNSSFFGGNNVRVSLDDGQLNVRTDDQPDNVKNIVEMQDSETQLNPQTDASFNTDGKASEIRVSRGGVETIVGGSRTVIQENEFASVDSGKLSSKEQLLASPKPESPGNMAQINDSTGNGANVSFLWSAGGPTSVSGYYLQVSKSPYFAADAILVDRSSITSRDFRLAALSPGTYYWRLKATARSGQTSEWSEPWKFTVVRTENNVAINVSGWKVEPVGGNVFIIAGVTQPGAQVRSEGRQIFAGADGSFRLQISNRTSEVAVEILDDRGNRSGYVLSLRSSRVVKRF